MKNKYTAAALAFFLGIFGTHRFYLGQRFLGVVYFLMFFAGLTVTIASDGDVPLIMAPAILAFIDSVLLAVMPHDEFDERYNRKKLRRQTREERYYEERLPLPQAQTNRPHQATLSELKRSGIEKFRNYDYEGAVEDFLQVIKIQPSDAATHFNLACCNSILEQKKEAFQHLQAAVDYGFKQFEKIDNHDALAFVRAQPEFDTFVKNGYRITSEAQGTAQPAATQTDQPAPEIPKTEPLVLQDDLLDQIIKLGELRDKGILTEEEFAAQKQKILAQR